MTKLELTFEKGILRALWDLPPDKDPENPAEFTARDDSGNLWSLTRTGASEFALAYNGPADNLSKLLLALSTHGFLYEHRDTAALSGLIINGFGPPPYTPRPIHERPNHRER